MTEVVEGEKKEKTVDKPAAGNANQADQQKQGNEQDGPQEAPAAQDGVLEGAPQDEPAPQKPSLRPNQKAAGGIVVKPDGIVEVLEGEQAKEIQPDKPAAGPSKGDQEASKATQPAPQATPTTPTPQPSAPTSTGTKQKSNAKPTAAPRLTKQEKAALRQEKRNLERERKGLETKLKNLDKAFLYSEDLTQEAVRGIDEQAAGCKARLEEVKERLSTIETNQGKQSAISSSLLNPTGKGIRNDCEGEGHFGARRGVRKHNGIDLATTIGQDILSPVAGRVRNFHGEQTNYPMLQIFPEPPSADYDCIEILYVDTPPGVIEWKERNIAAGDPIGVAVNLQDLEYSEGVTPHVHIQMFKKVNGKRQYVDPTPFFIGD